MRSVREQFGSTAATALLPWTPMLFPAMLRVQEKCKVSRGAEQKGIGRALAPEFLDLRLRKHRGHHLAALHAEVVRAEAAECRKSAKCHGALNRKSVALAGALE